MFNTATIGLKSEALGYVFTDLMAFLNLIPEFFILIEFNQQILTVVPKPNFPK